MHTLNLLSQLLHTNHNDNFQEICAVQKLAQNTHICAEGREQSCSAHSLCPISRLLLYCALIFCTLFVPYFTVTTVLCTHILHTLCALFHSYYCIVHSLRLYNVPRSQYKKCNILSYLVHHNTIYKNRHTPSSPIYKTFNTNYRTIFIILLQKLTQS